MGAIMNLFVKVLNIVIFFLLLFVLTQNAIETVTVRFFLWQWENVRLFVVILGSAAIGAVIGMFLTSISLLQARSNLKKLKKENKVLKEELDNLRNISIEEIPDNPEDENNQIVKKEN